MILIFFIKSFLPKFDTKAVFCQSLAIISNSIKKFTKIYNSLFSKVFSDFKTFTKKKILKLHYFYNKFKMIVKAIRAGSILFVKILQKLVDLKMIISKSFF